MTRFFGLVLAYLALALSPALSGSTIDPNAPTQSSNLTSSVVRNNFAAAYRDINNLLGMFAATTSPVNPTIGQFWRNTSTSPQEVRQWDGTQWVLWGYLNTSAHTFTFAAASGVNTVTGTPPITSSGGANPAIGLARDSNFTVNGSNQLAFSAIGAGNLIANCTAGTVAPSPSTLTACLDRSLTATQAGVAYRDATSWKGAAPGLIRSLSLTEYSLVPNDPASSAANTTLFQNAMAASSSIYCPAGVTYYMNVPVVVPTTVTYIGGGCRLIANGGTQGSGLLSISGNAAGLIIEDVNITAAITVRATTCTTANGSTVLTSCANTSGVANGMIVNAAGVPGGSTVSSFTGSSITVSAAVVCGTSTTPTCGAKPTTVSQPWDAIQTGATTGLTIRHTVLSGRYCLFNANATGTNVIDNNCSGYLVRGFDTFSTAAFGNVFFLNNHVSGGLPGSTHGYIFEGGFNYAVLGNHCETSQYFCYAFSGVSNAMKDVIAVGNTSVNSVHECINLEAVSKFAVTGNVCEFDATSVDIGLSTYANGGFTTSIGTISGNTLSSPGGAGISLSSQGGGVNTHTIVTGNTILNPNAQNKDPNGPCLELVDGGTQKNSMFGNTCRDDVGNMKWQVFELNAGGGNPNTNVLGPNYGQIGSLGYNTILGAASRAYTATIPKAAATANNWVQWIGPDGTQNLLQPNFTNLAGSVGAAQMPAISGVFYKAANQAYTATALARVNIDTTESNTGLTTDFANSRIQVPVTGAYRLNAQAYFLSTTSATTLTLSIRVNGVGLAEADNQSSVAGNAQTVSVNRLYRLSAGDFVDFAVASSVNQTILGSKAGTWLDINYVGP